MIDSTNLWLAIILAVTFAFLVVVRLGFRGLVPKIGE